MVRKNIYLDHHSENLILSYSLLKEFKTQSFNIWSVPGARPEDFYSFLPPFSRFTRILLFVGGNTLEDFTTKGGLFRPRKDPIVVALEIVDLAYTLSIRSDSVFVVGIPPRGYSCLQSKISSLNRYLSHFLANTSITFVGISHYLYDLSYISDDLCHFLPRAFAKIHKLLNRKVLKEKFHPSKAKKGKIIKSCSYPF